MEKIEKCAVIKYLFIKGMSTKEIYDDIFVILGFDGSFIQCWIGLLNLNVIEVALSISIVQDAQKMQQVLKTLYTYSKYGEDWEVHCHKIFVH